MTNNNEIEVKTTKVEHFEMLVNSGMHWMQKPSSSNYQKNKTEVCFEVDIEIATLYVLKRKGMPHSNL